MHSTEAEIAGMPNSLLNNGHSTPAHKEVRMSVRTEIVLVHWPVQVASYGRWCWWWLQSNRK